VRARAAAFAVGMLLATCLTGCTGHEKAGPASSGSSPAAAPSEPRVVPTPADPTAIDVGEVVGRLAVTRAGVGPTTIVVPPDDVGHGRLTVRVGCVGDGPAQLTYASGGLLMHFGCSAKAVYGAGPFASTAEARRLHLTVSPVATWRLAVFYER